MRLRFVCRTTLWHCIYGAESWKSTHMVLPNSAIGCTRAIREIFEKNASDVRLERTASESESNALDAIRHSRRHQICEFRWRFAHNMRRGRSKIETWNRYPRLFVQPINGWDRILQQRRRFLDWYVTFASQQTAYSERIACFASLCSATKRDVRHKNRIRSIDGCTKWNLCDSTGHEIHGEFDKWWTITRIHFGSL